MCGITGFVSKCKNKDEVINKMMKLISHRGPDGEGKYIDKNVVLGHVRLSIIDLSTGNQPMISNDGNYVIIYNGELYNYIELREELKKKKYVFNTSSDTEVLLNMYICYKEEMLDKLRGMFAFVIYDKLNNTLFGARDHFGIKPMYYYQNEKTFMFASEIKSFLGNPEFKKEFDKDLIQPYLSFNFVPTEETFFKGVKRLEPGHYFVYKDNKLEINRYFKLTFEPGNSNYQKYVDDISKVMKDSVNKHMLSDVEVGSFLSSGIDSSYIVSLAKPDKTYTVGYDINKYNESGYAKDLADKLGINNTSKLISKEEYFEIIPKIMYYLDEPIADPAAVALYFVSNLASKDVKVVLSGEGADELFGGYNYYREEVDYHFYNKIPYGIRKIISKFCSLLPPVRGINFLVRRGQTLEEGYIGVNKVFSERESNKLLDKSIKRVKNKDITKNVYDEHKNDSNVIKMQAIDINYWLIKDIFQKADKMTMANSIEGRVPFTDIEVFNVARTLPFDAKVTKENTKVALRDAAKKVIPNDSYKKKKLGFPVPLREWMKDDLFYNKIKDTFNSDIANELFNTKRIIKLLDDHKNNKKDNYKKIWTIYVLLVWYNEYFIKL